MAKKATGRGGRARGGSSAKRKPRVELSEHAQERLREVVSLLLLGLTLFLALACISAGTGENLCGSTGERAAMLLLGTFGYASWLLVLCFASWGLVLFTRMETQSFSMRASGLVLCLVSLSALLAHFFGEAGTRFAAGGSVGEYLNGLLILTGGLGVVGTRVILIMLTLVTFVLATDVAYFATLASSARWLGEKGSALKEAREDAKAEADEVDEQRKKLAAKEITAQARLVREEAGLLRAQAAADRAAAKVAAAAVTDAAIEAGLVGDEGFGPSDLTEVEVGGEEPEDTEEEFEEEGDSLVTEVNEVVDEGDEALSAADLAAPAAKRSKARAVRVKGPATDADALAVADEELEAEAEADEQYDDEATATELDEAEETDEFDADSEEYEVEEGEELEAEDGDELGEDEVEYEDEDEEDAEDEDVEEPGDEESAEFEDDEEASGLDPELEAAARSTPVVREMVEAASQRKLPFGSRASDKSAYVFPPESLLDDQQAVDQVELDALLAEKTEILERTLLSFKVEARVVEIQKGPVISMFEMELGAGIKLGKVRALEDDLAIALRSRSVRIVAPIPGRNTIGIEVPNPIRETVRLKPLLHCKQFEDKKMALPIFFGRDSAGRPEVHDLARMPHLLVAGATGSGKSVCLNTIICSFLYTRTPEQVQLVLIDPKMVEMSQFSDAPHLACPVVTDMKRAPGILEWAVNKMEERYKLLVRAGVRNITAYNKLSEERLRGRFGDVIDSEDFPRHLPYIVIIVDELADLMMTSAKEVETSISRLAAKSRAVGIHIILATQRPSTNVITGLIKANLPTRVAFMVSSKIDSRVILDANGAEQLLGMGDMLMLNPAKMGLTRAQCTFMSDEEVMLVMESVKTESGPSYEHDLVQRRPEGQGDPCDVDELYDAAVRFIIETQRGSASLLQRKFAIGYTRASRLIDLMAGEGVLGEFKGSQARDVEMSLEDWTAINPEAREVDDEAGVAG
ncbi:MAG: S-DNA-T family DNA segregation ATPase FtsK/SpoIIIE [Pseudohongiellaceae bacterium]|jgi:S-DNA-T family DNA segregation ATPase FtsK/SpoIIIE